MIRVRVQRIESIRDPEGNLGKRIELVEERIVPKLTLRTQSEEGRVVQDVMQALQQVPILQMQSQLTMPKMVLFLTEQEYEELGTTFDVNQIYEMELANGSIQLRKAR